MFPGLQAEALKTFEKAFLHRCGSPLQTCKSNDIVAQCEKNNSRWQPYIDNQSSLSFRDSNNTAARAGSCELGSLSLILPDPNDSTALVVRSNNDKTVSIVPGLLVQALVIGPSIP